MTSSDLLCGGLQVTFQLQLIHFNQLLTAAAVVFYIITTLGKYTPNVNFMYECVYD